MNMPEALVIVSALGTIAVAIIKFKPSRNGVSTEVCKEYRNFIVSEITALKTDMMSAIRDLEGRMTQRIIELCRADAALKREIERMLNSASSD